jgi:hypothetical protein
MLNGPRGHALFMIERCVHVVIGSRHCWPQQCPGCVYIGEQFSAARAARALYTHRNTVLNRLQRAERLLPLPLAGHGLEVGVALEIAQWLGTQPGSATHDR